MSSTPLPNNDSLQGIQTYLRAVLVERGFSDQANAEKIMLLVEEVGELARGVRKTTPVKMSETTAVSDIAEEAADVLIVLLDICNRHNVNLFEAFLAKEARNQKRSWK